MSEKIDLSKDIKPATQIYLGGPYGMLEVTLPGTVCQVMIPADREEKLLPNQRLVFVKQVVTDNIYLDNPGTLDVQIRHDKIDECYDTDIGTRLTS